MYKQPHSCTKLAVLIVHFSLIPRLHDTTSCLTGCTTGLTTVLNEQPMFVQPVVKPGCTTGLTTGCIHDTAGWLNVCIHDTTGLTTGYRVYKHLTGCQSGLTTGCIV